MITNNSYKQILIERKGKDIEYLLVKKGNDYIITFAFDPIIDVILMKNTPYYHLLVKFENKDYKLSVKKEFLNSLLEKVKERELPGKTIKIFRKRNNELRWKLIWN